MNTNYSHQFFYLRSIQGHSGNNAVDLALQDSVLLPNDFAEYIHHIGNAHDMHSIIQGGLIPGGRILKIDRQSVFLQPWNRCTRIKIWKKSNTIWINPESQCTKTWRVHQNTVYWCNLKLAQRKGLQFYQTRSHEIALFNTLLAICMENVVYMKTGEEFFCKVFQSPRLPRAVLTPNLDHGRQDLSDPEARTSADHQSERSASYEENCRGDVDCRVQGKPNSTVQKEDSNRKQTDSTVRDAPEP